MSDKKNIYGLDSEEYTIYLKEMWDKMTKEYNEREKSLRTYDAWKQPVKLLTWEELGHGTPKRKRKEKKRLPK